MTSGLAWLNDLMRWLGRWFPRLVLVKGTHRGVRFGRGGSVVLVEPGLCMYWPITSALQLVCVRQRSIEVAAQLLGCEIIATVVGFRITDPVVAISEFADLFAHLDDRVKSAIARAYSADRSSLEISALALGDLSEYFNIQGVWISKVDIVQRGRVIPLKNLNDWAQHSKASLDPDEPVPSQGAA